jgi:hypothetical protein
MPPSPGLLLMRLMAVVTALAVAIAMVFAMGTIFVTMARGVSLVDALTAPIAFVFFAGPPLLVMGMASRSTTAGAAALALALAVAFAVGLEALEAAPWHFRLWRANASEAEAQMLVATLFAAWPLTLIGALLWRVLNRETD